MKHVGTALEAARASSPQPTSLNPAPRSEHGAAGECDCCKGAGFVYVDVPFRPLDERALQGGELAVDCVDRFPDVEFTSLTEPGRGR